MCSQLSIINHKSAKNICKMPEGPKVEGSIICDHPIQCNDIRYDGDRNENAVVVVEEDKGGRWEEISTETHGLMGSRIYSLTSPACSR